MYSYMSFLKYSIPITNNPNSKNTNVITIGITMPDSITVVRNRPGGVDQLEVKSLAMYIVIANPHMVPINDKKPPIITFSSCFLPFYVKIMPCQ